MFVQVFFGLESFDVCTSTKLPPNLPASKTPFLVGVGGVFSKTLDTRWVLRRIGEGMWWPFRGRCALPAH